MSDSTYHLGVAICVGLIIGSMLYAYGVGAGLWPAFLPHL